MPLGLLSLALLALTGCANGGEAGGARARDEDPTEKWARAAREQMVEKVAHYSTAYRVKDLRVLAAMRKHIDPTKLVIVAAGDFQQAQAAAKNKAGRNN